MWLASPGASHALNGRRCKITLDRDPDYYYTGRLSVSDYNTDRLLRQITVEAVCSPWLLKQELTVVTLTVNDRMAHAIQLPNEKKPAVPTVEMTHDGTIWWGSKSINVAAGTFTSPDIELQAGDNELKVYFADGTGTATITYQEGSL